MQRTHEATKKRRDSLPLQAPPHIPRTLALSVALALALLAAACSRAESETIEELEASGAVPKLDRTDSLTGTDADQNGVRDDIDAFITREYPLEPQRKAALQTARALQKTLLVEPGDVQSAKAAAREDARACNCVYRQFPSGGTKEAAQVGSELESLTANTKQRLLALLRTSKTLDGTSWALPTGDTCE
ncbi:MAG: hypothetical protein B6A08_19615 [Sorangiineae bacterium NIC37A_2]|nr:MAG: hypothetical protein B6A08_19615 [Sorangiineae bacterium NIC37A_2]